MTHSKSESSSGLLPVPGEFEILLSFPYLFRATLALNSATLNDGDLVKRSTANPENSGLKHRVIKVSWSSSSSVPRRSINRPAMAQSR